MMTKIEAFKDYFDTVESMYKPEIKWDKNIVTVTLKYGGLALRKRFNAEFVNFLHSSSGAKYADFLFKNMLEEFERTHQIKKGG